MNTPLTYALREADEITETLDHAIREVLCAAFPHSASTFRRTRAWNGSLARWTVTLTDPHGRILAHAGLVDRTADLDGSPVRLAGVQNVAVRPDRQGQGLGAELMQRVSAAIPALDVDAGLLFCHTTRQPFYERSGWKPMKHPPRFTDEAGQPAALLPDTLAMWLSVRRPRPADHQTLDLNGPDW